MGVIFLLIGFSLGMAGLFMLLFVYALKNHQMDDTYTPAIRMLHDDALTTENNTNLKPTINNINK